MLNPPLGRVLVVDDDLAIRELLQAALARSGYKVTAVAGAKQALDLLEDATFDVILLDLVMPEMTGQEFFAELRRQKPALARSVIFVTGAAMDPNAQRFIADTGRPLLTKPFDLNDLEETVAAELATGRGAGATGLPEE